MRNALTILFLLISSVTYSQNIRKVFFTQRCVHDRGVQITHHNVETQYFASMRNALVIPQIPLDLATKNYGFFCWQELQMQRAHIPVAVRLGSMEQCNHLEQKPGYR